MVNNFYHYCHHFLSNKCYAKKIKQSLQSCSTYGDGLKWAFLNNVEPSSGVCNSAETLAELRHKTTEELCKEEELCKKEGFNLIDFMEKLNQIAKTRERLNKPLAIFFDIHLPQIYLSTFSNDRIKRQRGAFITPPILDGEDRDNPEEIRSSYKENINNRLEELKKKYERQNIRNKAQKHRESRYLDTDSILPSNNEVNNEKIEALQEVYKYVNQLNQIPYNKANAKIKRLRNDFLQLKYDILYCVYRQALTYSVKKLEQGTIIIDGQHKYEIKKH